jgi:hypothetical protein
MAFKVLKFLSEIQRSAYIRGHATCNTFLLDILLIALCSYIRTIKISTLFHVFDFAIILVEIIDYPLRNWILFLKLNRRYNLIWIISQSSIILIITSIVMIGSKTIIKASFWWNTKRIFLRILCVNLFLSHIRVIYEILFPCKRVIFNDRWGKSKWVIFVFMGSASQTICTCLSLFIFIRIGSYLDDFMRGRFVGMSMIDFLFRFINFYDIFSYDIGKMLIMNSIIESVLLIFKCLLITTTHSIFDEISLLHLSNFFKW